MQLIGPDTQRYLDMDCTLKEHQEDFGVRISREDTFLIKTKLSILISLLKGILHSFASVTLRGNTYPIVSIETSKLRNISILR